MKRFLDYKTSVVDNRVNILKTILAKNFISFLENAKMRHMSGCFKSNAFSSVNTS